MLNLQLEIFVLIGVGIFAGRMQGIVRRGVEGMSELFIQFLLPCSIFYAFLTDFSVKDIKEGILVIVFSALAQFFGLWISKITFRKQPEPRRKVIRYGLMCSNRSYIGIPVLQGIYGARGMLYASLALIPVNIFVWTVGISVFTGTKEKSSLKTLFKNPSLIAVALGLVFMATGLRPPAFLDHVLSSVSSCVTPISMIIIGVILSEVNFKKLFDKTVMQYCAYRLVIIPAVIFAVLKLWGVNGILLGVTVLFSGMPAPSLTAMLAEKYQCDCRLASQCIFVSTLLSIATLPVFCLLF